SGPLVTFRVMVPPATGTPSLTRWAVSGAVWPTTWVWLFGVRVRTAWALLVHRNELVLEIASWFMRSRLIPIGPSGLVAGTNTFVVMLVMSRPRHTTRPPPSFA